MRVGAVYPQIELGGDPGALKAFALAVEDLGYDHLVIYDHVLGVEHADREPKLAGPYTENDPFHEPFVAFGYLAALTQKIELVTGVIVLPQRQTALVAKQAAEIDLLSNERLRLGVGIGWNWVEFDALEVGAQFRRRGRREEEQIELLRKLWGEPLVTYNDAQHKVVRAGILPRPRRQIPIWLGGFSEPAFERAAKLADGFLFSGRSQSRAIEIMARMRNMIEANGRDPDPFGFESIQRFNLGPGEWENQIAAWLRAGGSHVSVDTMSAGFTHVDQHIEALRIWYESYAAVA